MDGLRSIRCDNPGPFTLDGTRTWILGSERVAVIDIGPDVDHHVRAVVRSVACAAEVTLILTHGHADHAGGTEAMIAARPDLRVVGAGHPAATPLSEGDRVRTDAGDLVCVPTPGHTRDHLALHHPDAQLLFCGDLLLGKGFTTWVAEYPGCVADYLASLARVEAMSLRAIHPTHGPVIRDPPGSIEGYRDHRMARIQSVRALRSDLPGASFEQLYAAVYGDTVPAGLRSAAEASLRALLHHVDTTADTG